MVKMSVLLSVNMISSNTLKEAIICVVTDNKTIERQFNYVIEKILPASNILYHLLNKRYEKTEIDNSCIAVSDNGATGANKKTFVPTVGPCAI